MRKNVFLLLCALSAYVLYLGCARPALAETSDASPLILVSIDGYAAAYLKRGISPTLTALAADGVRARALRPAFPSLTYPNHYTLVTGLYPDHHGIVDNAMNDPELGSFSPGNRAAVADGRWWDQAEPIWVTAEKNGIATASEFWPGTQADIRGKRPSYWKAIDPKVSPDARVDQVLAWLDLPPPERPRFVMLYFEQADGAGHAHGPASAEVDTALRLIDSALARLVDGLKQRALFDRATLLIVSDHGMAATSASRIVFLDKLVAPEDVDIVSQLVLAGINPKPGRENAVERALLGKHAHMNCWRKSDVPARFHYGGNARVPALLCLADPGWMVSTTQAEAKRGAAYLGEHGYAGDDPDMHALFVAHGPDFRRGWTAPAFDNVDVYDLLAHLLGIHALPNDGNAHTFEKMLVTSGK